MKSTVRGKQSSSMSGPMSLLICGRTSVHAHCAAGKSKMGFGQDPVFHDGDRQYACKGAEAVQANVQWRGYASRVESEQRPLGHERLDSLHCGMVQCSARLPLAAGRDRRRQKTQQADAGRAKEGRRAKLVSPGRSERAPCAYLSFNRHGLLLVVDAKAGLSFSRHIHRSVPQATFQAIRSALQPLRPGHLASVAGKPWFGSEWQRRQGAHWPARERQTPRRKKRARCSLRLRCPPRWHIPLPLVTEPPALPLAGVGRPPCRCLRHATVPTLYLYRRDSGTRSACYHPSARCAPKPQLICFAPHMQVADQGKT